MTDLRIKAQDEEFALATEPATEDVDEFATLVVWQLPLRIIHWMIFFAVVVLSVTGFYIGEPFVFGGDEPGFLMGKMKAVHTVAAWVFIAAIIARVIWAFTGNRWARWDQFVPVRRARRQGIFEALKFYTFFRDDPPRYIGHSPLAALTYGLVFVMFLFQVFTGLALMSLDSGGWIGSVSGWVFDVMPIPVVRLTHHIIMWLTWGFVVHHVYSAVLVDWKERSGLVSSIVTGRKRIPTEKS